MVPASSNQPRFEVNIDRQALAKPNLTLTGATTHRDVTVVLANDVRVHAVRLILGGDQGDTVGKSGIANY
jgi:hypothetical protein